MKKVLSFLIVFLLSFCVSVNAESELVVKNVVVESKKTIDYQNAWCQKSTDNSWDSCDENEIDYNYIFNTKDECIKNLEKDGVIDELICYEKDDDIDLLYEVEEESSFKDSQIDLSVNLHEVDDYIKYKIDLSNNTDKEITIDKLNLGLTDSEYITYELSGDTNIPANSTSTIYLTITYSNYVDLGKNVCTEKYNENQNLKLNYSEYVPETIVADVSEENPNTNTNTYILISFIIISIILVILIILNKNKCFKQYLLLILIFINIIGIITPILVNAEENTYLTITTNITIDNNVVCCSLGQEDILIGKVGDFWTDNNEFLKFIEEYCKAPHSSFGSSIYMNNEENEIVYKTCYNDLIIHKIYIAQGKYQCIVPPPVY